MRHQWPHDEAACQVTTRTRLRALDHLVVARVPRKGVSFYGEAFEQR